VPNRWDDLLQWCLRTRYVRQVTDAVFRARCRYTLARFEQQPAVRSQDHILTGLVHRARATRFGLDHDFRRIRTIADFRRLVPLRTPGELWRLYGPSVYPRLDGVLWPGPLGLTSTTPSANGVSRPLVISPSLLRVTRQTLQTALAFVVDTWPAARLLSGQTLIVGDDLPLSLPTKGDSPELRGGRGVPGLPYLLRPYALLASVSGGEDVGAALQRLAVKVAGQSITCLVGPGVRLLQLVREIKELTGRARLTEVWPALAAVLYTRRPGEDVGAALRAEAGSRAVVLEVAARSEAVVAVEDPRHDRLRLLHNHGVFFEFVPAGQASQPRPDRLGLDEVETGVAYDLAVSSPAGLWACRAGCTVVFESLDPPLIRFVEARRPLARRTDLAPFMGPLQPPHPQSAGTRAAPPGTAFHNPWSEPADRG
jgi:hypothetical protein